MDLIYFSPTYTSKRVAQAFAGEFETVHEHDITQDKLERSFGSGDLVMVSVPVYSGRIPQLVYDRLENLGGDHTKCVINVTYGNRDYDDALLELSDLVKSKGFDVVGAMATIGEHTYGDIQKGRPNQQDFDEIRKYARSFKQRDAVAIEVPGNRPYKELKKGGNKFVPSQNENCVGCNWCIANCPTGAINPDMTVDEDKCMACFRCVKFCPVKGISVNSMKYSEFAKMFSEKLKERKENRFF